MKNENIQSLTSVEKVKKSTDISQVSTLFDEELQRLYWAEIHLLLIPKPWINS